MSKDVSFLEQLHSLAISEGNTSAQSILADMKVVLSINLKYNFQRTFGFNLSIVRVAPFKNPGHIFLFHPVIPKISNSRVKSPSKKRLFSHQDTPSGRAPKEIDAREITTVNKNPQKITEVRRKVTSRGHVVLANRSARLLPNGSRRTADLQNRTPDHPFREGRK
ncbi:hypothetical protein AVEN_192000-1 [Araneus ventricosus]|uniref:Uncharacterized protein n=1 Tax=Araneus ventricosus TaxID=182803 RepID=A0A4Y2J6Y7_ARAVE|nr:hypothetical protein AVEN_192000-1 [Araneus ventricosus]